MKVFFLRRYKIIIIFFCLAVLTAAVFSNGTGSVPALATVNKPIYSVDTPKKQVAVSFDAAWGGDKTTGIMDILDSAGCKGTFFLVGFWVEKYPEKVKEIASRGFEIGNHSASHPRMSRLTAEQQRAELSQVNRQISDLTGVTPTLFRPPFGDYSDSLVSTVNALDMHCIQWSKDSLDWKENGVDDMVKRATDKVKAGDIILMHNNSKYILEALPEILKRLKSKGFEVVSVGELIYTDNYTVDSAGVQHSSR